MRTWVMRKLQSSMQCHLIGLAPNYHHLLSDCKQVGLQYHVSLDAVVWTSSLWLLRLNTSISLFTKEAARYWNQSSRWKLLQAALLQGCYRFLYTLARPFIQLSRTQKCVFNKRMNTICPCILNNLFHATHYFDVIVGNQIKFCHSKVSDSFSKINRGNIWQYA